MLWDLLQSSCVEISYRHLVQIALQRDLAQWLRQRTCQGDLAHDLLQSSPLKQIISLDSGMILVSWGVGFVSRFETFKLKADLLLGSFHMAVSELSIWPHLRLNKGRGNPSTFPWPWRWTPAFWQIAGLSLLSAWCAAARAARRCEAAGQVVDNFHRFYNMFQTGFLMNFR